MSYATASASERRFLPPAVAVSTVAFALRPPAEARIADPLAEAGRSSECERARGAAPERAADPGAGADTGSDAATLWIPLVRRTRPPFAGCWALPGGPIPWDETLVDTALRTLRAAVRRAPGYLEQLYSFGSIERSAEAQRLVTIAYWALYGEGELSAEPEPEAEVGEAGPGEPGAEAGPDPDPNVAWFSADQLPPLAFDHADIVAYALSRLRLKTEYSAVAHRFLGETFTLAQLRAVTEAIRGHAVDPANFRRQALAQGYLVDTGEVETGARHRPARLYRFRTELAGEPPP
jgi:ADP-ribose pyrophosphatase YjhB (NUDIX family)